MADSHHPRDIHPSSSSRMTNADQSYQPANSERGLRVPPSTPGQTTLESRKACRERFSMYQTSFNEMIEYLKRCHEGERLEERTNVEGEESNPEGTKPNLDGPKPNWEEKSLEDKLEDRSSLLGLPGFIADRRLGQLCYAIDGPNDKKIPVINLSELQRLNLYSLRKKLAVKAIDVKEHSSLNAKDAECIKKLMSDYCNALRDFDYMRQKDTRDVESDPFYLTFSRCCDWAIMKPDIDKLYDNSKKDMLWLPRDHDDPEMVGDPRGWAREKDTLKRFWFGLAGGLALIAPLLLIILHHDQTTALATASVATMFFALTMAFYHESDASPLALVGATAAYAAVLVVLVGTTF